MSGNAKDTLYLKVIELVQLDVESIFKDLDYDIESLHEIIDLVKNTRYFVLSIENTALPFQNRKDLLKALVEFVDKEISNIPNELEALENERLGARYWDEVQHFHETEGLSEKQGKLNKIKNKLLKEFNSESKSK